MDMMFLNLLFTPILAVTPSLLEEGELDTSRFRFLSPSPLLLVSFSVVLYCCRLLQVCCEGCPVLWWLPWVTGERG